MQQTTLTPAEEQAWMKTRTVVTWTVPGFSHIFYTLLNNAASKHIAFFTEGVPVAATDGSNIIINPRTFFKYTLMEQVFVVGHEILHAVFDHPRMFQAWAKAGYVKYPDGLSLPFDPGLMNVAGDLHINDILVSSAVGKFNSDWVHDRNWGTKEISVVDIYRRIYRHQPKLGAGFDVILPFGATSQSNKPPERNPMQWEQTIAAAAHITKEQMKHMSRNQGLLAMDLVRTFEKINEPVVTWEDKLQALFARKVGSGSTDWRRPDRRFMSRDIYVPAKSQFQCGDIVVACDTSGSMSTDEIAMCFSEIGGILEELTPRRLFVLWCDATVHRVDEMDDVQDLYTAQKAGAPGGGGTDFRPVFNWIKENCWNMPDALVFFTDGYGTYPSEAPTYPVMWGSITPNKTYPFGDVIEIPMGLRY